MVTQKDRALQRSALSFHLRTLSALVRGLFVRVALTASGLWSTVALVVDRLLLGLERGWRDQAESTPPRRLHGAVRWVFRIAPRLHALTSWGAGSVRRATAAHLRLARRADQRLLRAVP
ncbi:MAG: hypothetical protein V3R95_10055 [Dehalococcoidia bacterium]